jgi:hypothetical protein
VYGFVLWLPSIIKEGSSMGLVATGWLSAAPYLLAVLAMLAVSWYSDKLLDRRAFVWPSLLIGALAFYGSYLLGTSNFWLSFVLLVIAGGAMYALWSILRDDQRDVAEERRRRSHGAHQQHGRARILCRLLRGRLPERRHRQPQCFLHADGRRAGIRRGVDPARASRAQAVKQLVVYQQLAEPLTGKPQNVVDRAVLPP